MAANAVRGERTVSIGGKDFELVPSYGRLAKLEAMLGHSLVELLSQVAATRAVSMSVQQVASAVEILARSPKLSVDVIGPLVVAEGVMNVLTTIVELVTIAMTGEDPRKPGAEAVEDASGKGDTDEPNE